MNSHALPVVNIENPLTTGVFPEIENPNAVPNIFCSAIPILKNRVGNFLANLKVFVDNDKSASKTTIFLFLCPILTKKSPNVSLREFSDIKLLTS
ncbi:hypothetical protein ES703_56918 [subsurface metagenome]